MAQSERATHALTAHQSSAVGSAPARTDAPDLATPAGTVHLFEAIIKRHQNSSAVDLHPRDPTIHVSRAHRSNPLRDVDASQRFTSDPTAGVHRLHLARSHCANPPCAAAVHLFPVVSTLHEEIGLAHPLILTTRRLRTPSSRQYRL